MRADVNTRVVQHFADGRHPATQAFMPQILGDSVGVLGTLTICKTCHVEIRCAVVLGELVFLFDTAVCVHVVVVVWADSWEWRDTFWHMPTLVQVHEFSSWGVLSFFPPMFEKDARIRFSLLGARHSRPIRAY